MGELLSNVQSEKVSVVCDLHFFETDLEMSEERFELVFRGLEFGFPFVPSVAKVSWAYMICECF